MDPETFFALSNPEIAALARAAGPCVCAFPINGTRRWFLLEHPHPGNYEKQYTRAGIRAYAQVYQLLFEHGLDTLLLPCLGDDLIHRGAAYATMAVEGVRSLATDPLLLEFYKNQDVRIRFYGNYRNYFSSVGRMDVLESLDQVSQQTAQHKTRHIFYGLFANDATEQVAEHATAFYQNNRRAPTRREIIEMYYGEYVDPVRIFIGFDKCSAYDMPLLATGSEDLYFTVAPSLYLTPRCLRAILYDHLFSRRAAEPDYIGMSAEAIQRMRGFYYENREKVMGVGILHDGLWYPQPFISLKE